MSTERHTTTYLLLRFSPEGDDPVQLGRAEIAQCDPARDGECSFLAYGATGSFTLHGDRIYIGRPDWNEIRVLDSNGDLQSRIRGATPLQPVTETMCEEFRDAVVAGDPSRAAQRREYVSRASCAEVVPAFLGFVVSADGHIWAQEFRIERAPFGYSPAFPPRTAPVRWTVYRPDGIELGKVEIPADFRSPRLERTTCWGSLATTSVWNESRCTRFPNDRRSA